MSGISLQGLSLKPEFTYMASLVCKLTLGRLSNLPSTGTTTQLLCLVGIYVHSGDRQLGLHVASTLTPLSRTGSEIFVFLLLFVQGWGLIFGFCHHCQVLAQKFWCHEICHSQKATKMTSEGPPPPGSLSTTGGATHQACVWYLLWTHTWRRPWRCPLSCFESEPKQKNRKQISSEKTQIWMHPAHLRELPWLPPSQVCSRSRPPPKVYRALLLALTPPPVFLYSL